MPNRANGAFTVDKQNAEPVEWQGGQMSRTSMTKTFTGDLTGTSVIETIMAGLDDDGARMYVGIERFDCSLDGRKGTFVLLHSATNHGSDYTSSLTIVPGSGAGELTGIRGEAEILPDHSFVLTYEIED